MYSEENDNAHNVGDARMPLGFAGLEYILVHIHFCDLEQHLSQDLESLNNFALQPWL